MIAKESLALALSELIKRLSSEEKIELMRHISWKELEEWKVTQESLSDTELMANLKKGLADEKKGLKQDRIDALLYTNCRQSKGG